MYRLKKILKIIKNTDIPFSYKIHVETKGNSWAEALSIAIKENIKTTKIGFIFLDDDAFPQEGWMNNFEKYIKQSDIIGWTLVSEKGICGSINYIIKHSRISFILHSIITRSKFISKYEIITVRKVDNKHVREVPCLCGAAVFMKKKVFETLGDITDLDEDYGYHFKAIKEGFKIILIPNKIIHYGALTKKNIKERQEYKQKFKARLLYDYLIDEKFTDILRKRNLLIEKLQTIRLTYDFLKTNVFIKLVEKIRKPVFKL